MATYHVLPRQRQTGFKVEVVGDDGGHNTILGFASQVEAEAWVEDDRKLEAFRQRQAAD